MHTLHDTRRRAHFARYSTPCTLCTRLDAVHTLHDTRRRAHLGHTWLAARVPGVYHITRGAMARIGLAFACQWLLRPSTASKPDPMNLQCRSQGKPTVMHACKRTPVGRMDRPASILCCHMWRVVRHAVMYERTAMHTDTCNGNSRVKILLPYVVGDLSPPQAL